jgi:hypothetical protein
VLFRSGSIAQMCYYVFRVWGKYRTNVLLRVSCLGEVSHKCVITCFVFGGSIAQMCYYAFRVLGKYHTNVLLHVSCFGEVSYKICSYVFRVLGKYRAKHALACFVFWGSIAQMQKIFRVPRRHHKNVGYVYWYGTAQMWRISSAPAKLKYSTCLVFLGSIAKI